MKRGFVVLTSQHVEWRDEGSGGFNRKKTPRGWLFTTQPPRVHLRLPSLVCSLIKNLNL